MCGIVGYSGTEKAVPILLEGLSLLEYRGYDSAGLSLWNPQGILTYKATGRLENLGKLVAADASGATSGIGHTRWATHGEPSVHNAHPHGTQKVSLVHNGIIENYQQLKTKLTAEGYVFESQTDTEAAAKLVDFYDQGDPLEAIQKALKEIEGSYAFGILFADQQDRIYGVRKGSPLLVAQGETGAFLTSDLTAVLRHTPYYMALEEGEIVCLTGREITLYNPQHQPITRPLQKAEWSVEQAEKAGHPHFMLKEILEQPRVIGETLHPRIREGRPNFEYDRIPRGLFRSTKKLHIVACGTAMYAGMAGRYLVEQWARLPCEVHVASEFRYGDPLLKKEELVIVISQSGETADSLEALRLAKSRGVPTIAIVNVVGSSIAREADYLIQTFAGPEIAVASTKAYSVQLAVIYLLALQFALEQEQVTKEVVLQRIEQLEQIPQLVEKTLEETEKIQAVAKMLEKKTQMFFLGRGQDYALCCEGALKMKEISYLPCEAYAAGELKHGPIALIEKGTPVLTLMGQKNLATKTQSNAETAQARGAELIHVCHRSHKQEGSACSHVISIPDCEDAFSAFPIAVVLQLLAYYTALGRGCDIDKPRNLAKSVTVE